MMAKEKTLTLDEKLATLFFHADKETHILVKKELCVKCVDKPCLTICPAGNYTWYEADERLVFNFEGCLECGSCRLICPLDAIEWSYPRGSFGVSYHWG
jgi:ferredoxin like protein